MLHYPVSAWQSAPLWHLSDRPVLEIGMAYGPPEYQLYRVTAVCQMMDGRIVVANAGTFELRFYDAAGHYLFSAGGKGNGPGEFRDLTWLDDIDRDSLIVFDRGLSTVSVFDIHGRFRRSFRLDPIGPDLFPYPVGLLEDGDLLVYGAQVFRPQNAPSGLVKTASPYVLYSMNGEIRDTVGRLPGPTVFLDVEGSSMEVLRLPLGPLPDAAVYRNGFFYTDGADEIQYHAADGEVPLSVGLERPVRPVTSDDVAFVVRSLIGETSDPRLRTQLRRTLARVPYPDRLPGFSQLLVDNRGNIWGLETPAPRDSTAWWTIFSSSGALTARVASPTTLRVYDVSGDHLVGVVTDSLGVERVRVYSLKR